MLVVPEGQRLHPWRSYRRPGFKKERARRREDAERLEMAIALTDAQLAMIMRRARQVGDVDRDQFFSRVCDLLRALDPRLCYGDVRHAVASVFRPYNNLVPSQRGAPTKKSK
jgi:hypothetical protein